MAHLIQQRRGKKNGTRGTTIIILSPNRKSKSFTIHGYTQQQAYDKTWFLFYNENKTI